MCIAASSGSALLEVEFGVEVDFGAVVGSD